MRLEFAVGLHWGTTCSSTAIANWHWMHAMTQYPKTWKWLQKWIPYTHKYYKGGIIKWSSASRCCDLDINFFPVAAMLDVAHNDHQRTTLNCLRWLLKTSCPNNMPNYKNVSQSAPFRSTQEYQLSRNNNQSEMTSFGFYNGLITV